MATKEEKEIVRKVAITYGKKGGKKTLERYGNKHFKKIAKAGAEKRWNKAVSK